MGCSGSKAAQASAPGPRTQATLLQVPAAKPEDAKMTETVVGVQAPKAGAPNAHQNQDDAELQTKLQGSLDNALGNGELAKAVESLSGSASAKTAQAADAQQSEQVPSDGQDVETPSKKPFSRAQTCPGRVLEDAIQEKTDIEAPSEANGVAEQVVSLQAAPAPQPEDETLPLPQQEEAAAAPQQDDSERDLRVRWSYAGALKPAAPHGMAVTWSLYLTFEELKKEFEAHSKHHAKGIQLCFYDLNNFEEKSLRKPDCRNMEDALLYAKSVMKVASL